MLTDELYRDGIGLARAVATVGDEAADHAELDLAGRVDVTCGAGPAFFARHACVKDAAAAARARRLVEVAAGMEGRRAAANNGGHSDDEYSYRSLPGSMHAGSSLAPLAKATRVAKSGSSRVPKTLPPLNTSAPR